MSLQEAASSGSFNPRAAQPSDDQKTDSPFHSPYADDAVDQAAAEPASPFANPYDFPTGADEAVADGGEPDMRATRRRAWTVVGLAIVIPAAVAGVIAWQMFGTDPEPAPTITRVTTAPAEVVAQPVQSSTAPTEAAAAATATTPMSAAETTTQAAAVTTSTSAVAAETEASEAAVAAAEPEVDLSSLDPAARLAAWTDIETIQVLPGETLWLIAQNYDTTVSAIATLNNISDPSTLSIGQQLMIPVGFAEEIVATPVVAGEGSESAVAEEGSAGVTATVDAEAPPLSGDLANWHSIAPVLIEEGDGLAAIADANNTTIEAIMALNGITDPDLILVGDMLLVPVGYQGDASVVTAAPEEATLTTGDEGAAVASSEDLMEEEEATGAAGEEEDLMEE